MLTTPVQADLGTRTRGQVCFFLPLPKLSGRTMAPCGLPRFPWPSLKFRTVSFPQYGFKAGILDVAFPARWFAIALRALCYHGIAPALCRGPMRLQAPPCQQLPLLYPRGLAPVRVMLSRSLLA
jgi:hypothetical protein